MKNLIFYIITLSLFACSLPPDMDNEDIKKLALECSKKAIINNFTLEQKILITKSLTGDIKDVEKIKDGLNYSNLFFGNLYSGLASFYRKDIDQKLMDSFDNGCVSGKVRIENIRINYRNYETGKSECNADLVLGVLTYAITYSAQYMENGQIYVESRFRYKN